MLTKAFSTSVHQTDAGNYTGDLDEDRVQQYLMRNAHQIVCLAMEYHSGSAETNVRDLGVRRSTTPSDHDIEQDMVLLSQILKVAKPRILSSSRVTFHALQEWEGYVTEIGDTEFTVRLTDLTSGVKYASEEASIPLDEISDDDADRIQVGSIFRWVIGYERAAGSKKRVSNIVFRDLPVITKYDVQDGRQWANKIMAAFEK